MALRAEQRAPHVPKIGKPIEGRIKWHIIAIGKKLVQMGQHPIVPGFARVLWSPSGGNRKIDIPHSFGLAQHTTEQPYFLDVSYGFVIAIHGVNSREKVVQDLQGFCERRAGAGFASRQRFSRSCYYQPIAIFDERAVETLFENDCAVATMRKNRLQFYHAPRRVGPHKSAYGILEQYGFVTRNPKLLIEVYAHL